MNQLHYDYECGNCGHCFNERDAKCEDWRIPEKSFMCPNCNSYLSKISPFEEFKNSTGASSKNAIYIFTVLSLVIVGIWVGTYCLVKYTTVAGEVGTAIQIIVFLILIYDFITSIEKFKITGIRKYRRKTRAIK